jgi:hypothetical protein
MLEVAVLKLRVMLTESWLFHGHFKAYVDVELAARKRERENGRESSNRRYTLVYNSHARTFLPAAVLTGSSSESIYAINVKEK